MEGIEKYRPLMWSLRRLRVSRGKYGGWVPYKSRRRRRLPSPTRPIPPPDRQHKRRCPPLSYVDRRSPALIATSILFQVGSGKGQHHFPIYSILVVAWIATQQISELPYMSFNMVTQIRTFSLISQDYNIHGCKVRISNTDSCNRITGCHRWLLLLFVFLFFWPLLGSIFKEAQIYNKKRKSKRIPLPYQEPIGIA